MVAASLMDEAKAGDERAFVQLLSPQLPAAYRLAFAMLRSGPDAEDAVQEAVLNAWRHFYRFRSGSDVRPWLLAIVANQCRSQLRSRWFSVIRGGGLIEPGVAAPPVESATDLHRALHRLPYDQRLAVVLRYYMDLSFDEMGRTLGISAKAAKSRTRRGLARLRLLPEVLPDD